MAPMPAVLKVEPVYMRSKIRVQPQCFYNVGCTLQMYTWAPAVHKVHSGHLDHRGRHRLPLRKYMQNMAGVRRVQHT